MDRRGFIIKMAIYAVILLVVFGVGVYVGYKIFYPAGHAFTPSGGNTNVCAIAGEISSNPSLGPEQVKRTCCDGLVELQTQTINNGTCTPLLGGGNVCSDCGNGVCETWENKCNCPADCS